MASTASSASTSVGAGDILQQYERLLYQLSQQVLEQEEEIRSLRTTRQASRYGHHRCHIDGGGASGGRGQCKRAAVVLKAESLSVLVKEGQHDYTHNAAGTEAAYTARVHGGSPLHLTLPLPSTPQVSSIGSAEDADDHSVMDPSSEPTAKPPHSPQDSAARAAVPSWTRFAGKRSEQHTAMAVLACSSAMCDVSGSSDGASIGLTPSAVCDAPPSSERETAAALWGSSLESEMEKSGGSCAPFRCHRTTAQWTQHTPSEMPQVTFDGQDAMSYLLSVFSSARSARETDGTGAELMAKSSGAVPCGRENGGAGSARSPSAALQQRGRHVARRLFHVDLLEEDEGSERGSEPLSGGAVSGYLRPAPRQPPSTPSHDKRGVGNRIAPVHHKLDDGFDHEEKLLQERYVRIMTCALAAEGAATTTALEDGSEQQRRAEARPRAPAAARHRTTSLHDHDTSATVAELLRLFAHDP
ncbi:hypothetical protein LSCM1_06541 [Leishmania martiniquensis]|uniref:Uncharacterized protein n=1 Tax=Leishmania martiniquensis TaxID=1580590 RepID=A0A836HUX9_9TRYP|nr:hypothetical protein LSCM1_06541 [Leishmania martiniquensis]